MKTPIIPLLLGSAYLTKSVLSTNESTLNTNLLNQADNPSSANKNLPPFVPRNEFASFMRKNGFSPRQEVKTTGNDVHYNPDVPGQNNKQPAGAAARLFQSTWEESVLANPGSIHLTREQLGFKENQIAMVDVGGEGEKTENQFKSGNANAINLNAECKISPGNFALQFEPGGEPPVSITKGFIPNLIRPGRAWPDGKSSIDFYPFSDGFANITLMEGAPLFDNNVKEIARTTNKQGWIFLNIDDAFSDAVEKLAKKHNGGTTWTMGNGGVFSLRVIPPKSFENRDDIKSKFDYASSHQLYDIVEHINHEEQAQPSAPRGTGHTEL